jgi:hypothetical protein
MRDEGVAIPPELPFVRRRAEPVGAREQVDVEPFKTRVVG